MKNAKLFPSLSVAMVMAAACLAAPRTDQNGPYNVNVNPNGANPAAYQGSWPADLDRQPSPDDWRSVAVYQFITDRFCDGNPLNNREGIDLYDQQMRHGGDFKGITARLDYVKSLGFQAIWISPIFINGDNGSDYHGYAQLDFTVLDPRFGTLDDLRELTQQAHARGMYVIVDVVVNHMANLLEFVGQPDGCAPFRFYDGEYDLQWRDPFKQYSDFKFNNNDYWGRYCPVNDSNGNLVNDHPWGNSFWDSDFHHNGSMGTPQDICANDGEYSDAWACHLGKIYGTMDDLRTTHPNVQNKIIAMTKALITSTDIDGIRMDTPMQVPLEFFKRWCPAVKQHAASLGKNDFLIFGEFFCSRGRAANMVGRGRTPDQHGQALAFIDGTYAMDGGINYPLYHSFFQPAVKNQANGTLSQGRIQYAADTGNVYDFYRPQHNENRYLMYNFFNNHDQWRMVHSVDGFQKTDLASAILAFWPGVPTYYYGDEQGFCSAGSAIDGSAREDMMTSKAWYGIGTGDLGIHNNPAIKDNFDMCHPQYLRVQKYMNVRRQYPALRNTDEFYERWCQSNAGNGIYAFTRAWGAAQNWALVVFNTWNAQLSAGGGIGDFWTGWAQGDTIVNVFNPAETYVLGAGGKLNALNVGPYECKVFVRQNNLKPLDPVVQSCAPAHDARVFNANQAVVLSFSEAMNEASVKAAFRFDGAAVPAAQLVYNAALRTLTYQAPVAEGIHTVEILDSAQSAAGRSLYGKFRSRFRRGSNLNPIANPQQNALVQPNLIESPNDEIWVLTENGQEVPNNLGLNRFVTLRHDAVGALFYRLSADNGENWSEWVPYQPVTVAELPGGFGQKTILVQYWADGSSAYFAQDTVTIMEVTTEDLSACIEDTFYFFLDLLNGKSSSTLTATRSEKPVDAAAFAKALNAMHRVEALAQKTKTGAYHVKQYYRFSPELFRILVLEDKGELRKLGTEVSYKVAMAAADYFDNGKYASRNPFAKEDWEKGRYLLDVIYRSTKSADLRAYVSVLQKTSYSAEGKNFAEIMKMFL